MGSYTSQRQGILNRLREIQQLSRSWSDALAGRVTSSITYLRAVEERIEARTGLVLRNLDVLDIGSGQIPIHLWCLACHNRAVGIDTDVIVTGLNFGHYLRMLRRNGTWRAVKTLGRQALGIDRRVRRDLQLRLGLESLPAVTVDCQDACQLQFCDASFDFVHSFSVFHHTTTPAQALGEVARVLRPGGVAHISFQLYTGPHGSLDPRVFLDDQGQKMLWPHLRKGHSEQVHGNAFLNKLRLEEWRELFQGQMPGAELILNRIPDPELELAADRLVGSELSAYSLDDLLTHNVIVVWKKPEEQDRAGTRATNWISRIVAGLATLAPLLG